MGCVARKDEDAGKGEVCTHRRRDCRSACGHLGLEKSSIAPKEIKTGIWQRDKQPPSFGVWHWAEAKDWGQGVFDSPVKSHVQESDEWMGSEAYRGSTFGQPQRALQVSSGAKACAVGALGGSNLSALPHHPHPIDRQILLKFVQFVFVVGFIFAKRRSIRTTCTNIKS